MKTKNTLRFTLNALRLESGFTLVELLLYTGIFLILLGILFQVFTAIIGIQLESNSTSSVSEDGEYILSRLTYDTQRSTSILSPSFGATSSALTLSIGGSQYVYSLNNGNLFLGTDTLNGFDTKVSTFSATRGGIQNSTNTLTFSFTLVSSTSANTGPKTENFQTTVSLRPNQ